MRILILSVALVCVLPSQTNTVCRDPCRPRDFFFFFFFFLKVHNILEGKKETENVLATQPEFLIVKDYKWNDPANLAAMHLLGLVQDRGLRSVRDLRGAHVPLLKAVREAGLGVLKQQFGIDAAQVRSYFHYLPTFYHLHVHWDHVSADVTATHAVSKAILLDDVIGKVNLDRSYPPIKAPPPGRLCCSVFCCAFEHHTVPRT